MAWLSGLSLNDYKLTRRSFMVPSVCFHGLMVFGLWAKPEEIKHEWANEPIWHNCLVAGTITT